MNKNEFVNALNEKSGLSKKDCKMCLNAIIEVVKSALQAGESVSISNFGKFKVNNIKAKCLYNFQTRETQIVDARKIPSFKASESLKQSMR